jgi:hypothetical protein
MNAKLNCWEVKQCGRELGGKHTEELGVCPAAIDKRFSGHNDGENAGRYCWRVAGTLCDGETQGLFAEKALTCCKCEFFLQVVYEEGPNVKL